MLVTCLAFLRHDTDPMEVYREYWRIRCSQSQPHFLGVRLTDRGAFRDPKTSPGIVSRFDRKCIHEPAAQHGPRAGGCGFLDPELQRPGQARLVAPGAMETAAPVASNETSAGRSQNRRVEVKGLVNRGLAGER